MAKKTYVEELAAFATKVDYGDLSEEARAQLKLRVLDTIGCAIAALGGEPLAVRADRDGRHDRARPRGLLQRRVGALC